MEYRFQQLHKMAIESKEKGYRTVVPVLIPIGSKVGEVVRRQFETEGIIDKNGKLTEPLEVRVFDRNVANLLIGGGLDSPNNMTWTWPYNPDTWGYNESILENPNHPGGFLFYKASALEPVANQPGRRRFVVRYAEGLKAIFIQEFPNE